MTTARTNGAKEPIAPPWGAEAILRLVLSADDFETVSGDLIEEYRRAVYPARGRSRANRWYMRQVAGFIWRSTWGWGVLLAALFVGRTALDWFVPPATFWTRSVITTYSAISLFLAVGFWAAYRTHSLGASAFSGVVTSLIAKVLGTATVLLLLGIWHDPQTMSAIERSGGLAEVFTLPGVGLVIGGVLATCGGLAGKGFSKLKLQS